MRRNKMGFEKVHLQWFGDYDDKGVIDDPEVPVEGGDEFEMVEVGSLDEPYEEKEEKITLTPEEFEDLQRKGDSASALQKGIAELGATINKPGKGQEEVAPQQPGESWDDFKKRLNSELFGDNPAAILDEYVNRKLNPVLQQVGGLTGEQQKELMMVKDETKKYFRKYKGDIEEFHKGLPPDQRSNPRSWQYAYDEVLKKKQSEIIEEEVQSRFDEMFQKKMAEMGMEGSAGSAGSRRGGPTLEGGGMAGYGARPSGSKKKQVRYTAEDKRKADKMGLEIEDYLLGIGRLD
jgi:hypothetical protein